MPHRTRMWTAVAVMLLTACDPSPQPDPPVRTTAPPDAVGACSHPTATVRTDRGQPVGGPLAPTIGGYSFHAYENTQGYPTKFIIHAKKEQPEATTLTGSRCSDGRPLRFWYDLKQALPGPVPMTEERLRTTGDQTATLPPVDAGVSYTGHMLFSSNGKWQVTVSRAGAELGVLLIEVT